MDVKRILEDFKSKYPLYTRLKDIDVKEKDLEEMYQYALNLCDVGKHKKAQEFLRLLVKLDETNPMYWYTLGSSLFLCKKYREALQPLSKAITIKPYAPEPWYCSGESLIGINDLKNAEKCFTESSSLCKFYPHLKEMQKNSDRRIKEIQKRRKNNIYMLNF